MMLSTVVRSTRGASLRVSTGNSAARDGVMSLGRARPNRPSFSSSSSNTGKKTGLPPPLPSSSSSAAKRSPSQAKQDYLKSQARADDLDPIAKMANLQKELDVVRERAAEKLEKQLNKSVYRRLTDPLRRHQHAVINVGAVLLAYILAHNLYQKGKEVKRTQAELETSQEHSIEFKNALQTVLNESTIQALAAACVEELNETTHSERTEGSSPGRGGGWFSFGSSSSGLPSLDDEENQQKTLERVLKRELEARLGDFVLDDEQRKEIEKQKAWQESQEQLMNLKDNPEQVMMDVLKETMAEGETTQDASPDGKKKPRHVFSM